MTATAEHLEAEPVEVETVRVCRGCGVVQPLDWFGVRVRAGREYVSFRCRACENGRRRRWERETADPDGGDAIARAVDRAPDPAPAVALRLELARQRAKGRPWSSAWPCALSVALDGLPVAEQVEGRATFGATRPEWEASYAGTGRALALTQAD